MDKQHLIIIIDNNKIITPKKYWINFSKMKKESFIEESKKLYENKYQDKNYETYYFEHTF